MMLEGAGFEVVDLGVDVPQSAFAGNRNSVGLSTPLAATGVRDQITRRAPISAAAVGEHLPQQERNPWSRQRQARPRSLATARRSAAALSGRPLRENSLYRTPGMEAVMDRPSRAARAVLWAGGGSASLHDPNSNLESPVD